MQFSKPSMELLIFSLSSSQDFTVIVYPVNASFPCPQYNISAPVNEDDCEEDEEEDEYGAKKKEDIESDDPVERKFGVFSIICHIRAALLNKTLSDEAFLLI